MNKENLNSESIVDEITDKYFDGDEQKLITHLFHRSHDGMRNTTLSGYETAENLLLCTERMVNEGDLPESVRNTVDGFILNEPMKAAQFFYTEKSKNTETMVKPDSFHEEMAIKEIASFIARLSRGSRASLRSHHPTS